MLPLGLSPPDMRLQIVVYILQIFEGYLRDEEGGIERSLRITATIGM